LIKIKRRIVALNCWPPNRNERGNTARLRRASVLLIYSCYRYSDLELKIENLTNELNDQKELTTKAEEKIKRINGIITVSLGLQVFLL
jgi:hypothetical protein